MTASGAARGRAFPDSARQNGRLSDLAAERNAALCRKVVADLNKAQAILDRARRRIPADKISEEDNGLVLLEQTGLN